MLSFRTWEASFERYCHRYLHVSPAGSSVWTCSILPIVLQMMVELLKLLDSIFQHARNGVAEYFIQVASLQRSRGFDRIVGYSDIF